MVATRPTLPPSFALGGGLANRSTMAGMAGWFAVAIPGAALTHLLSRGFARFSGTR